MRLQNLLCWSHSISLVYLVVWQRKLRVLIKGVWKRISRKRHQTYTRQARPEREPLDKFVQRLINNTDLLEAALRASADYDAAVKVGAAVACDVDPPTAALEAATTRRVQSINLTPNPSTYGFRLQAHTNLEIVHVMVLNEIESEYVGFA